MLHHPQHRAGGCHEAGPSILVMVMAGLFSGIMAMARAAAQFYGYGQPVPDIFYGHDFAATMLFSPSAIAAPETPDLGHFRFSR